MDLFGRKARAQLEVALAWIADLQSRLDEANYRAVIYQGAHDRFVEQNNKLDTKVRLLQAELENPQRRKSPQRLYKTEEEEELEFALRNGDINMQEFKDLLAQTGFENTEIELPERPERPIIY
jgi:hypothetical protein